MKRFIQKILKNRLKRYKTCTGFVLFRWGQFMAELWHCPKGFVIERHNHPLENIELFPIWGASEFFREGPDGVVQSTGSRLFKFHSVPRGWFHWFTVNVNSSLVFINFSLWTEGHKPTSASEDFEYGK